MIYQFGEYLVDTECLELSAGGDTISIQPQAFALLKLLIENHNRVVTKDEIIEQVWDGRIVSDATLNTRINAIRRAVGDSGEMQSIIKTFPRRGFRFVANLDGEDETAVPKTNETEPADIPSIAVLPFTNIGGNIEQEVLADGISEEIVTGLAALKWLMVIARSSTDGYKAREINVREIGRELGVRYLLQGSIQCSGDKIRVVAHLIEAETGARLWGERYDRQLGEIFAVQDEITQSVIGCLLPELYAAEIERADRKPPQNLDAWECFVRAMYLYSQHSQDSTSEAIKLLIQAAELDDTYARALALHAVCLVWRAMQGWENMGEILPVAIDLANRASHCDMNEPWTYIAHFFIGLPQKAEQDIHRAISRAVSLSPNFAYAHALLGCHHGFTGRTDEALKHIDMAMQLSPRDTFTDDFQLYRAFTFFQAGRYEEALAAARAAAALRPGHPVIHVFAIASQALSDNLENIEKDKATLLSLVPNISASHIKETFPFYIEADRRRLASGLIKAGIPE